MLPGEGVAVAAGTLAGAHDEQCMQLRYAGVFNLCHIKDATAAGLPCEL
jgi:hypothetical protein